MSESDVYIDNSMLQDIYTCSTRAWAKYVQKKRMRRQEGDGKERLEVGSMFHRVFERFLKGEGVESNLTLMAEEWQGVFPEGARKETYYLPNLLTIARVWLENTSRYFREYEVIAVEERLEMELAESVVYFGTPDVLVQNTRGEIWIIDTKTTGWIKEETKKYWLRGSQGIGYWELVREKYGKEPKGVLWHGLELSKVPPYDGNLEKRCSVHKVKYKECQRGHVRQEMVGPQVYNTQQIKDWYMQVLRGVMRWRRLRDTPLLSQIAQEGKMTYPGCSMCEFSDWCWAGRNEGLMESMMEGYEWPLVMGEKEEVEG